MTTNTDVITRALQELYVLPEGVTATGQQIQDGLDSLNRMMALWAETDKDFNFPPQDTPGDTIPIPLWAEEAVITNLAIYEAAIYGAPISADLAVRASTSEGLVTSKMINLKLERADMSHLPQGSDKYRYDIESDT